jgi:release factor glutamine methyltransferase
MEALSWGRDTLSSAGVEGYDLDCQLLLSQAMGRERSELLAFTRRPVTPREVSSYRKAVKMRARRMPAAYILGKKEFWSADFAVDGRVLIPRPETEVLVETAAELLRPGSRILDVGTGSGCIIVSLASGWRRGTYGLTALRIVSKSS